MLNINKKGFSLVEVMLLLVVFSVILAASIQVVTKKTKTPPINVKHGVYRCIASDDGRYVQEVYNTHRLLSRENVDQCSFAPPKHVTQFQVDYYSAGAGGTNYAEYRTLKDSKKDDTITYDDMFYYSEHPDDKSGSFLSKMDNLPFELEAYLETLLLNFPARIWNVVTNYGNGGDMKIIAKPMDGVRCVFPEDPDVKVSADELDVFDSYKDKRSSADIYYRDYCIKQYKDRYKFNRQYLSNGAKNDYYLSDNDFDSDDFWNKKYYDVDKKTYTSKGAQGAKGGFAYFETTRYGEDQLKNFIKNKNLEKLKVKYPVIYYMGYLLSWDKRDKDYWDNNKDAYKEMLVPLVKKTTSSGSTISSPGYATMKKTDGNSTTRDITSQPFEPGELPSIINDLKAEDAPENSEMPYFWSTWGEGQKKGLESLIVTTLYKSIAEGGEISVHTIFDNDLSNRVPEIVNKLNKYIYIPNYTPFLFTSTKRLSLNVVKKTDKDDIIITNYSGYDYIIKKHDYPSKVVPRIVMNYDFYMKKYRLGGPGSPGKHKVTYPPVLGDSCSFDVPHGGKPMNYVQNPDADFRNYEKSLGVVTMTCKNKDGNVVYNDGFFNNKYSRNEAKVVSDGGTYDLNIKNEWPHEYKWDPNDTTRSKLYEPKTPEDYKSPADHAQPIWSKILNTIANSKETSLSGLYRVGEYGEGTYLTDNCRVPKGDMEVKLQKYESTVKEESTLDAILKGEYENKSIGFDGYDTYEYVDVSGKKIKILEQNGANGKLRNGFDCYKTDTENGNSYVIKDTDKEGYSFSAKKGGGGAIVITW